ncbi:MAG TPA: Uma2 family endonuclease [Thermodesulfovibrionia bacterium]|nr:Uma2 family endonuclease [Thermodesulfovibrionia bacterium]
MIVKDFASTEPLAKEEILKNLKALPTEDELPSDDGEPMETARHRDQMHVLIESLKAYWGKTRRYYVGGNMFLHYQLKPKKKFRGPDFYLVLDVDDRERKSWVVWQEGMRFPDVIIELLSSKTKKIDKVIKKELYETTFQTVEYFLYDPESQEFYGYRLVGDCYKLLWPDGEDKIYSVMTGLYLKINDNWLRWMTEDGEILPTPMELAEFALQMAKEAQQRADEERQKTERERQKAEQERQRAEQERRRAEQERRRAEEERRKTIEAEQKLRQAEEILETYRRQFGSL